MVYSKARMPLKILTIYNHCELYQNQFSNLTSKSEKQWGGNSVTFYDFSTKVS